MVACPDCGRPSHEGPCPPRSGQANGPAPKATLPLGSPEDAEALRSETLLLGSGVPLEPRKGLGPADPSNGHRPPRPVAERRAAAGDAADRARAAARQRARGRAAVRQPATSDPPEAVPRREAKLPRPDRRWALVVAGMGAVAALMVLVLLRRAGDGGLQAELAFDAQGGARLRVECASCPDGAELRVGDAVGRFEQRRAELALHGPLGLGVTKKTARWRTHPTGSWSDIELAIPVDHVISVDLRGLSQVPPKAAVVVDALPEIGVIVDGQALPHLAGGARRREIELTDALTGPAETVAKVVRRVPYAITRPGGGNTRAQLEITVDVAPLRVEAPLGSVTLEAASFLLAGVTQPSGLVTVEGRPITVDPAGRFAQAMSVSSVGDTTIVVRASAPGLAPRSIPIRVKRVTSLAAEAAAFSQRATSSYAALADRTEDKIGWAVVLSGKVAAVRTEGYVSRVELDVNRGCPTAPCLAELELAGRSELRPGDAVTAYGHLAGKTLDPTSGRSVPRVRVEFVRGEP